MKFEFFFNFNGNAREAMEFYADAFQTEVKNVMTYGQTPADPNFQIKDEEKDLIMYAEVQIGDKAIMFMDNTPEWPITFGDNITPVINGLTREEVDRLFAALQIGGQALMAPSKMFFSEYYAMVKDKFGLTWHLMTPETPVVPAAQ